MFDSKISVKQLIDEVKSEADIALPIPNSSYVTWLNSLHYMLYTAFIKEQSEITVKIPENRIIELNTLNIPDDEDVIRFEDIYVVYSGDNQLIHTGLASGSVFDNCYYKKNNNMAVTTDGDSVRIIYLVKPKRAEVDDNDEIIGGNVRIPLEFIEIAKARLRGEAYSLANEYGPAANWLNTYNVLLENFKQWLSVKAHNFAQ